MSVSGYQSDVAQMSASQISQNSVTILEILPEHLNPGLQHSPVRNRYSVINGNLVVGKDARLRPQNGQLEIAGWQVSLPAPLVTDEAEYTGTLLSLAGNHFFYAIGNDGRVFLRGIFANEEDEVILNVNPYLAELPLRFRPFGMIPVFSSTPPREQQRTKF